jgi:predicted outer membrane protein
MEIYNEIQTFTCDKEMKEFFKQLRKNKVNVSKFIRDSINKNRPEIKVDKRKKTTVSDLKKSLEIFENQFQKNII